jgi:tripartite-type tricarboxylate transporter receptor subunit TctC
MLTNFHIFSMDVSEETPEIPEQGNPPGLSDAWSKAVQDMLKDPEYLALIKKEFFRPFYHGPKEMVEYIKKESEFAREVYGIKK